MSQVDPHRHQPLAKRHYRAVAERLDEEARGHRFVALHPREDDLATIRGRAEAIVQRYEWAEEQRLVAEALERSAAGGLAVSGLRDCLWGASVAAIGQLLVQDGPSGPARSATRMVP